VIIPTNQAIDASARELSTHRITFYRRLLKNEGAGAHKALTGFEQREVLVQLIQAAIPHLTDTGQPAQCGQIRGREIHETCDCGHRIGLHRFELGRMALDDVIVCDPCLAEAPVEQPIGRRLDRLAEKLNGLIELVEGSSYVSALEVDSGPTDYEVWRDALTLAVHRQTAEARMVGEAAEADDPEILNSALWFRDQLKRPIRDVPDAEHKLEPLDAKPDPFLDQI
jgi:hypothetical protein